MTFENFNESLAASAPPAGTNVYLTAMWYDAHGDWKQAHHLVDSMEDTTACWVHAYLHRKEGDQGNAAYWYRRAGRKNPDISLPEEWKTIVQELLLL